MNAQTVGGATARALTRRLTRAADRLDLYAALSDDGRRRDTMLLETLAGPSLILDRAALRIECRGREVVLTRLTPGGAPLLGAVARALPRQVESRSEQVLRLRFERVESDDSERRLLAPSPFDALRALTAGIGNETPEEPFTLALLGIVAFDHVDLFEDLPANPEDPLGFPDFIFWVAESLVVAEPGLAPRLVCTSFGAGEDERARNDAASRLADLAERCGQASGARPPRPSPKRESDRQVRVETDLEDDEFAALVTRMKDHVLAGDVYQIVPSRSFRTPCSDPLAAFAAVRSLDLSPYMFYVAAPDHVLFGASPETSVRVTREAGWPMVEVKPIAGTRPRGADADEDDRMEADLRLDMKEVAEHMMLVDLARNDVARVSIPGTRRVVGLMSVERYARVMHLVSSVKGALAIGYDALHALAACLNVGTLSGAPKIKATELIRRAERTKRGPYGGAIGWLSGDGTMDSGVIIRSAVVKDGTAFVRAGAGIVHDSDPMAEADETRRKASAILSAIVAAEVRQ
jgi:anthranilate synthase component 1